jgi:hypothetical protein
VRGAIIGFGVGISLLCSCMPELAANGAARCSEQLECSPDAVCYRGFCLSPADVADASVWEAGSPSGLAVDPGRDAGSAAVADSAAQPDAATAMSRPASEAGAAAGHDAPATDTATDAGAATPPSTDPPPSKDPPATVGTPDADAGKGVAGPGTTAPDASRPGPAGMGPTSPADAGPADSGATPPPTDAAMPPASLRPGCTFAECCEEALRAAVEARDGDDKEDKKDDKGGKRCGCANPALLGTVFCSLVGPWGVLP